MGNRFKEARSKTNMSSSEVAEKLGVSQATMSHIETGKRLPSVELLCKMADLYGTTTDFLLGRADHIEIAHGGRMLVEAKALPALHGIPVWVEKCGWGVINSFTKRILFAEDFQLPFSEAYEVYTFPPSFALGEYPITSPLLRSEIRRQNRVWVEPLFPDQDARRELRGWYSVFDKFVRNEFGNTFYYDNYEAKWLAFEKEE